MSCDVIASLSPCLRAPPSLLPNAIDPIASAHDLEAALRAEIADVSFSIIGPLLSDVPVARLSRSSDRME